MARKNILTITALAAALALAGCGGGGSDGYFNQGGSSNNGGSSGGGTDTPAETAEVHISTLSLSNTDGASTQIITVAGAVAKVKVTDKTGAAINGALVTFSSTGGVEFGTSNGAVLTNAEGEASISVKPIDATDTGSYYLTATVEHDGISATTPNYNFSLQAANIALMDLVVGSTALNSGASTNITLKTKDANTQAIQNNVTVNFAASCGTFDPATVVSSNQGDVTTSYKAIGTDGKLCEGTQTITVTGTNIAVAETVTVDIAAVEANSLVYTSDAVNMGIKSSGSASSGQIEFTLYADGVPATNKEVRIDKLQGSPEDLSFVSEGNFATQVVKSDSQGKVIVNLYPGNKPGPVEIKATLVSNDNVFALSKDVAVSTGRVYQSGLSLSVSKNALRTDIDGDIATVTAMMADRNGNRVPDGTVISFVAEGGSIEPNCKSEDGACTVELRTQNPRPANNRVSVLAYVEGDKAYTDLDGDNLYTEGVDTLDSNIGDFFRDDDENLAYDADNNEYLYKRSDAGTAACAASTITQPNLANTCHNRLSATLRHQMLFAFSHDAPTFVGISGIDQAMTQITNDRFTFQVFGNTQRLVPMPSGTTVSVEVKDNTENELSCEAEIVSGYATVPNVMSLLTPATFGLASNDLVKYTVRLQKCAAGDDIKVSVQVPGGQQTTIYLSK